MTDKHEIKRIRFDGREYEVIHAYLYADEKLFDIWLRDSETGDFTHQCCEGIDGFSLEEHQLLIRDRYFGVLQEAGVVNRVGGAFEMPGRGTLHKCDVAEREIVPDVYEWKTITESDTAAPPEPDTIRGVEQDGLNLFGFDDEESPDGGKNPYRLAGESSPRVFFEGRERRVIFAAFDIGHFVDIWLTDAETDRITHCCTEMDRGSRIDEYEVLVEDKYMSILMETGLLQPRGEVVMKDFSMLHRCKMLERGFIPYLDYHEDFAKEVEEDLTSPVTVQESITPIQAECDLDDRDLGDEIEF